MRGIGELGRGVEGLQSTRESSKRIQRRRLFLQREEERRLESELELGRIMRLNWGRMERLNLGESGSRSVLGESSSLLVFLFCSLTVFVLLQSHDLSPDLPPHGLPPSIASLRMESDPIDQRHLRLFWINVSAVSLSHQTWTRPDFFFFLSFHSFSLLPQSLIYLSLTVQANLLRLSRILYSGLGTSLSTSPSLGDGGTRGLGRGSSHRRRLEAKASSQVGKSEGIRADHRRRRNQTPCNSSILSATRLSILPRDNTFHLRSTSPFTPTKELHPIFPLLPPSLPRS